MLVPCSVLCLCMKTNCLLRFCSVVATAKMAVHCRIFGLSSVVSQFRSLLLNRNVITGYQQRAGIKQAVEEKLGLPPRPKRPLTPYFRFMMQIRPVLLQKNPNIKLPELSKMIAKEWEDADVKIRERLEAEFRKDLEEFAIANLNYQKSLTEEQRNEIKDAKREISEKRQERRIKKKKKELGRPKKPLTPFLVYMKDNSDKRGSQAFHDFQSAMAVEWEKLAPEKKNEYLVNYRKDLEIYKRDIQDWEEKMVRLGHIDLVRNEALIEKRQPTKKIRSSGKSSE